MDYFEAFRFLFRSPKWGMNLLYGSVLGLIPVIGPIVLIGYFGDVTDMLLKNPAAAPPDLDFGRFGKYLERGIWPFLASMLVGLLLIPLGILAFSPLLAISALNLDGPVVLAPVLLTVVLLLAAVAAAALVSTPVNLHAIESRKLDLGAWPRFVNDFIRRVGTETLLGTLFLSVACVPLFLAGYACCFIGVYPAMTLFLYAQWHVIFQLYALYLERGGEAVGAIPADDVWIS